WSFGSSESRRKTSGSMRSGFFNHLPQLLGRFADEFSAVFHVPVTLLRCFLKGAQFGRTRSVLLKGIIRGFNFHLAESNDIRAGNNADILPARRRRQPSAEISLRVR